MSVGTRGVFVEFSGHSTAIFQEMHDDMHSRNPLANLCVCPFLVRAGGEELFALPLTEYPDLEKTKKARNIGYTLDNILANSASPRSPLHVEFSENHLSRSRARLKNCVINHTQPFHPA